MDRKQILVWIAGGLAILAAWTSGSLLLLHAEKGADLGLLAGICAAGDEGCASVVNSRWGVIPPGPEGQEGPFEGIPVAALGFLYYSLLAGWYLFIGIPEAGRQWLFRGVLWINGIGLVGSIIYSGIMLLQLGSTCYLCLLTHGCNGGIFIISWILRARTPQPKGEGAPTPRLLGAATVAVALACFAQLQIYQSATIRTDLVRIQEETVVLQELARDVEKLETLHRSQQKHDFGVRPDDPKSKTTGGKYYQLVIFSDVECPNCARFDTYLKETILPIWNGHLQVVWKHYPNSADHPHAMEGATALEAARLQGKFWELREWLLPRRSSLGAVRWEQAAAALEMDATRFLEDMKSSAVASRIRGDVAVGRKASISGTPAVFLNGRMVSRLLRRSPGFWKIQADSLRDIRLRYKQEW